MGGSYFKASFFKGSIGAKSPGSNTWTHKSISPSRERGKLILLFPEWCYKNYATPPTHCFYQILWSWMLSSFWILQSVCKCEMKGIEVHWRCWPWNTDEPPRFLTNDYKWRKMERGRLRLKETGMSHPPNVIHRPLFCSGFVVVERGSNSINLKSN